MWLCLILGDTGAVTRLKQRIEWTFKLGPRQPGEGETSWEVPVMSKARLCLGGSVFAASASPWLQLKAFMSRKRTSPLVQNPPSLSLFLFLFFFFPFQLSLLKSSLSSYLHFLIPHFISNPLYTGLHTPHSETALANSPKTDNHPIWWTCHRPLPIWLLQHLTLLITHPSQNTPLSLNGTTSPSASFPTPMSTF